MNTIYRKKRTELLFANQMSFRVSTVQFIDCLKRKRSIIEEISRCTSIIEEQKRIMRALENRIDDENTFYFGKLDDIEKNNKVERSCTETGCRGILRFEEEEEHIESDAKVSDFEEFGESVHSLSRFPVGLIEEANDEKSDEANDEESDADRGGFVSVLGILGDIVMVCTSCKKRVCGVCYKEYMTERGGRHVCKQEDLDSLRVIEKDCKPCPGCGVPIMYISGCSQMFCTICNCAFDWRTLRMYRSGSYFHNPHYASFRESYGGGNSNFFQNTRILPEEISFLDVDKKVKENFGADTSKLADKSMTMKGYLYFANEVLDKYGKSQNEREEFRHRQLRVHYMLNEIEEDKFKESLYLSEQQNETRDMVEEELRTYAIFTRNALLRWAKLGESSEREATESIELCFAEAKRRVLEFCQHRKKSSVGAMKLFATNNYFLSSRGS